MKIFSFIFSIFILCFSLSAEDKILGNNPKLPTVAIIATGGTIAEKEDPKTGASVPAKGEDLIKAVPTLFKVANVKLVEFSNIDSSQMTPDIWARLSKKVDEVLKDSNIVGAIITHGTDTMAQGSFFLDLTLKTKKPVVFTGAMRNSSDPYSDGPFNLITAVFQVLSPNAHNWGVTVTLNQYINSARHVVKTNTTNPQTFESGAAGYLGFIFNKVVTRVNDRVVVQKFPIPKTFPKIDIFMEYAGAGPEIIRFMVDSGSDAIVIEGFGAGNVSAQVFEGVEYALKKGVLIVITTIVPEGGVFPIYGDVGGGADLKKAGVLFARFLRADKARILLLLAMPYVGKDKAKLEKLLNVQ